MTKSSAGASKPARAPKKTTTKSKPEAKGGEEGAKFRWGKKILDRDEQHQLRREVLLRTAAQAFNETSFHTTTLDDLALRLNVTKPTLYYYIKDKDDILFECQRKALALIEDVLDEQEPGEGSGAERLEHFLRRYAELMTDDFGICLVRTGLRPLKPESRAKLIKFARRIDQTMRDIIRSGIDDGTLLPDLDPRLASNAAFGAFNGIAQWHKPNRALTKEAITDAFITMFLRAFTGHGSTTGR